MNTPDLSQKDQTTSDTRYEDAREQRLAYCRTFIEQEMLRHDWQLVTHEELVARVLVKEDLWSTQAVLKKAALDQYALIMYDACCQDTSVDKREQGYGELFRFLLRTTYKRWPDLADEIGEEIAQRAIVLVFEQRLRCHNPRAFLSFAIYKVRQAFKEVLREQRGALVPLDSAYSERKQSESTLSARQQRSEEKLYDLLLEILEDLSDARIRRVIWLKFLEGWNDSEIAAGLEITPNYVRVLRNRGITQIRNDKRLQSYRRRDE